MTLWRNVSLDTIRFKSSCLSFFKELHADNQELRSKSTLDISSIKDNLMLRALMLQDVDHERQDIAEKNLEMKL